IATRRCRRKGDGTTITSPSYSSYRRPSSGHCCSSAKVTRGSVAFMERILHRRARSVPHRSAALSPMKSPARAQITAQNLPCVAAALWQNLAETRSRSMTRIFYACAVAIGFAVFLYVSLVRTTAVQQADDAVRIDADDIGGAVKSAKGPAAGGWASAETRVLQTKVGSAEGTDGRGRQE